MVSSCSSNSMTSHELYLYTRMEAVEMAKLSPITYRFLPSGDSEMVLHTPPVQAREEDGRVSKASHGQAPLISPHLLLYPF